ncbi:MAG: hypothetical protein CMH55_09195 [Myxococcales bacterium]|nr:hypothetical protein [Myxococcales bacterium]|tara:strand:- start:281 stop:1006 length:726 start_codon:yes stop_codon:yes gene_type:complete
MLTVTLTLAALVAAIISGMIGMAGGILLLTVMLLAGLSPAVAIPLHAVVQLTSNVTRVAAYRKTVRWRSAALFIAISLPMPWIGLQIVDQLDPIATKGLIGLVVLAATWAPKGGLDILPERVSMGIAGTLAGIFGVVIGAVGPLVAPFFLRSTWKKEEVVGSKAACQSAIHLIKIGVFSGIGFAFTAYWDLLLPLLIAVIVGTWIGKALNARMSPQRFVLIYRVVLSLLALRLIYAGWLAD